MTEEFLHYIWKYRKFDAHKLFTSSGESITIVKPGDHNTDAGPDFFNAKIKIGKTTWAGNVEIHVNSSDWEKHAHQNDKAYDNIILHVVYKDDKKVVCGNGEALSTLQLKGILDESIYKQYVNFKSNNNWIPCENQVHSVSSFVVNNWLDRILIERLERKSQSIVQSLKLNKNNWEETFYQQLARSFGSKVNAEPFELLAKALPIAVLSKHKNSLFQMEALFFGQAGMLVKPGKDEYYIKLQLEYYFLKQKFKLQPIEMHLWKFLRLRPVNFPTIRIAQFACLVYQSSHLFSKILEADKTKAIKKLLMVEASSYWNEHYQFNKKATKRKKTIGSDTIDVVIINTIVPFLFVYGKQKSEEKYVDKALHLLDKIVGEKNSIIEKWRQLKMPVKTAHTTQALLELKNEYCKQKRCLECGIGNALLVNRK